MTDHQMSALRSIPIFEGLDETGLRRIADLATEFEVRAGHVFIERGQDAAGCFIVEEGTARVELADGRGIDRGPGEFFGELSVLTDAVRSARVMAATDIVGVAIRRDDLLALLEAEPSITLAMLKAVAARFVDAG